jgi:TM2 domain-containing membrane protein YozV
MTANDRFCRNCGSDSTAPVEAVPASPAVVTTANASDKSRLVALLLCFLIGVFGVHRFYVGKIGTGLLWLFTLGFIGIGVIYDLILIIAGEFKDRDGRKLLNW